jgi:sterol desaturase/sphingolipid hydroxylase (fatty acid hydroxylase superfamily)
MGCFWQRKYHLDKMSHADLLIAYFSYPAIQTYLALAFLSSYMAWRWGDALLPMVLTAALVAVVYPFVWYALHRFVLHGAWLYKSPLTAALWKRIHFDHHRDPHDLRVLFGALYTTLPTVVVVVVTPIGYLIGGRACAAGAVAAGLLITCLYEYCHCIQHLGYVPRLRFMRKLKALHLRHHFKDERSNFGIVSFWPDRLFSSYREIDSGGRSPHVFNLGYTGEELNRFPWVAHLTPELERPPAPKRSA